MAVESTAKATLANSPEGFEHNLMMADIYTALSMAKSFIRIADTLDKIFDSIPTDPDDDHERQGTLAEYVKFAGFMHKERWINRDYYLNIGEQIARPSPFIDTPVWAQSRGIDTPDYWAFLGWRSHPLDEHV